MIVAQLAKSLVKVERIFDKIDPNLRPILLEVLRVEYGQVASSSTSSSPATSQYVVSSSSSNGSTEKKNPLLRDQAKEVLTFLNEKTGKTFRFVDTNLKLIEARLASGATVLDCKGVIARMAREWLNDPQMRQYLRPVTLFSPVKFEQYLGLKGTGS